MMKKKEKKSENSERWLLTYSDLITLLMILFVILYAMSNVNLEKYDSLSESLSTALGSGSSTNGSIIPRGGGGILTGETPGSEDYDGSTTEESEQNTVEGGNTGALANENAGEMNDFAELRERFLEAIESNKLEDKLRITIEHKGMVISLPNDILFESGQAEVKKEMKPTLDTISELLNSIDNPIQVEGYTDNVPVNKGMYKSNWQLSAQRAANVVQYLVENYEIEPERLTAIGYGEYKPFASNETEEGREKNRRISITILFDEESTD